MSLIPASQNLFFSKGDPQDRRRGEQSRPVSATNDLAPGYVICGYPDDEGIKNNGGRPGAAQGPDSIRSSFYRMVATGSAPIYDLGNLSRPGPLVERHEIARKLVHQSLEQNMRWIGLGGGHDYGYADGSGFLDWCGSNPDQPRPLVINIDAHLDVREDQPLVTSGTPFFRLHGHATPYDMIQIGIQDQCNADAHRAWSLAQGHTILTLEEHWRSKLALDEFVIQKLGDKLVSQRRSFLSIDIDAFAWPYAIGASQSWPKGIEPREFWPLLELLIRRLDVRVLGIYETSPPLEFGSGTSKLASLIVDTYLRVNQPPLDQRSSK